ncbi:Uncharacterised protein [Shigella sonnei]|nr:Uncharacterised protein [Shigella sonnei]
MSVLNIHQQLHAVFFNRQQGRRQLAGDEALGQLHPFFFTYRNIAAIVNRTFRVQRLQGTN